MNSPLSPENIYDKVPFSGKTDTDEELNQSQTFTEKSRISPIKRITIIASRRVACRLFSTSSPIEPNPLSLSVSSSTSKSENRSLSTSRKRIYDKLCSSSASSSRSICTDESKTKRQSSIRGSFVVTSPSEQHTLEIQTTRFVAASLSAFIIVENPQFIQLWQMLRSTSLPPTRANVSNKLLDEVFEQEISNVAQFTKGERATLAIDGWSTITSAPVLGVAVTVSSGRLIFSHAIDTTGIPHTSENLLKCTKEAIQRVESVFNVCVVGVVTDGAANMNRMRNELRLDQFVYTYSCQAHLLNLICKQLDKVFFTTTSKV